MKNGKFSKPRIEFAPDKEVKKYPVQRALFEKAIAKILNIPTGMFISDESRVGDFLTHPKFLTNGQWMDRNGKTLTEVQNKPVAKLDEIYLLSQELDLIVTKSDLVWKVLQSMHG